MMREIRCKILLIIIICFVFMGSLSGCKTTEDTIHSSEVHMRSNYQKDDFKSIIIGQSTYKDVYDIAPSEIMQITSYGGVCEYRTQTGGCIRIKFYGKDLIVGDIEEIINQGNTGGRFSVLINSLNLKRWIG